MIRRPPRSTQSRSSAASDVYKRQGIDNAPQMAQPLRTREGQPEVRRELPQPARVALLADDTGLRVITQNELQDASPCLDDPRGVGGYVHAAACRGVARSDAVSYTHLRAHETRHDLVCRLLLEKKKRKRK